MSNRIVSPSLMYPFVSWINALSFCLLCVFCLSTVLCVFVYVCMCVCMCVCFRDNVEDSVGISPIRFAWLSCFLDVMNLIPNEMQQCSLRRRDVLRHPANSSSELKGWELIWRTVYHIRKGLCSGVNNIENILRGCEWRWNVCQYWFYLVD